MKRTIEEIIAKVKDFQSAGFSTFQAMAAVLNENEWNDLIPLMERLQEFYKENKRGKE